LTRRRRAACTPAHPPRRPTRPPATTADAPAPSDQTPPSIPLFTLVATTPVASACTFATLFATTAMVPLQTYGTPLSTQVLIVMALLDSTTMTADAPSMAFIGEGLGMKEQWRWSQARGVAEAGE